MSDGQYNDSEDDDIKAAQIESSDDDAQNQGNEDDEDHEGSVDSEEFNLSKPINPLGGGVQSDEHHDSWNFDLGAVADMASNQIHKATAAAGNILPLNLRRRKTFSISFQSRNIPFEFLTNPSGAVVVSHVSKAVDERLHRGVVVVGVNDSVVGVSDNASVEMEKLLDSASPPFTVIFEEFIEDSEDHGGVDYEEESNQTDSLDDEEHAGGRTKPYASTNSSGSSDKDDKDGNADSHGQHSLQQDLAATASSSASLLTSSIFSLTNRMRSFVSAPAAAEAPSQHPNSGGSVAQSSDHSQTSDSEEEELPENYFELVLPTRSPPFVFDLHADGSSIVVVKLVGDRKSMDPRLQEGCVVRLINSQSVECKSRQEFDAMLSSVQDLPMRMVLEMAPALYRHQDALSLFTSASSDQAIHIFTVTPHLHSRHGGAAGGPRFDDVYHTSRRALDVLQAFRAQGVAVGLVSVETVLMSAQHSAYSGTLYQPGGGGTLGGIASSLSHTGDLLRAIRVWFRFSDAQDVSVDSPMDHIGALEITRDGTDGSWIVIRCLDAQSVWVDAGMVIGRPYLVTHVNGLDVSASGYRSVSSRARGDGTWEGSVLPHFDQSSISITIV